VILRGAAMRATRTPPPPHPSDLQCHGCSIPPPFPPSLHPCGAALFIAGAKSDYCTPVHWDAVQQYFGRAERVEVAGCGHYVHAEKPKEVEDILTTALKA
jgi:pimeloyl-ACP methyl ester carboxylesterase